MPLPIAQDVYQSLVNNNHWTAVCHLNYWMNPFPCCLNISINWPETIYGIMYSLTFCTHVQLMICKSFWTLFGQLQCLWTTELSCCINALIWFPFHPKKHQSRGTPGAKLISAVNSVESNRTYIQGAFGLWCYETSVTLIFPALICVWKAYDSAVTSNSSPVFYYRKGSFIWLKINGGKQEEY